jgi:hypothetical protein
MQPDKDIDPRSLDKVVYEVHDGVDLYFNEETDKPDGWYWVHDPYVMHGPYQTVDEALNAAAEASNLEAELHIMDMRDVLKDLPPPPIGNQ